MLSKISSAALCGIDALIIEVESDISKGLPVFSIVGLPDASVKESRDRVVSAIRNSGFDFPIKKITINLAPADVKKEGASFDLPIALGILIARESVNCKKPFPSCFLGELALDGSVRPVRGVLPCAIAAKEKGFESIVVPFANAREAAVVQGLNVFPVASLREAADFLNGNIEIKPFQNEPVVPAGIKDEFELDFAEVKGQAFAKRALEVAAAGGHNVVMVGPPGSGKTMLARRLPGILPQMNFEESLETTKIHSVAGVLPPAAGLIKKRVFRSPHHTISDIALIGGGSNPKPGEVSLAHNGVLFLDEFTEFRKAALEVLRQPLEDRFVNIARAKRSAMYPSSFMLVAAMNPCPCGNCGHPEKECLCTPYQIRKYRAKISEPLLDRIDIHIEVPALRTDELASDSFGSESHEVVRERVIKARKIQEARFSGTKVYSNSMMGQKHIKKYCVLDKESRDILLRAVEKLSLSARAYDKVLKVSRTIADLEGCENIAVSHVAEAVQYRAMDRG